MKSPSSAAHSPTRVRWRSAAITLAVFGLFQLALGWWGMTARSERWHIALPFAALLWLFVDPAAREWLRRPGMGAALVLGIAITYGIFWMIHSAQAKRMGGQVDPRSIEFHTLLALSCFVMFLLWRAGLLGAWRGVEQGINLLRHLPAPVDAPTNWVRALSGEICLTGIAALTFGPYIFVAFNAHRPKVRPITTPESAYQLSFENVSFPAAEDGLRLAGWWMPRPGSDKVIIVCHGVGSHRGGFLGVAPFLHRAGYNVLMFDFRGHGESGGYTTSFGINESRDVRGAVAYAAGRGFRQIALYSFSMGAASTLLAMPHLPPSSGVRGVVVDSTFADFRPLVREQSALVPLVGHFIPPVSRALGILELGCDLEQIVPERHIGSVAPRPLLIIHGLADILIPVAQARQNYEVAHQPKELFLVPGANHCECHEADPAPYEKHVVGFLRNCFVPSIPAVSGKES